MQMTSKRVSSTTLLRPPNKTTGVFSPQLSLKFDDPPDTLLTATTLAVRFAVRPATMNAILARLGWIRQASGSSGWQLTEMGRRLGARQSTQPPSARQHVVWPETIVHNPILINAVIQFEARAPAHRQSRLHKVSRNQSKVANRPLPGGIRATDGHFVRSRAELVIDNWLYSRRIAHEYERSLPFDETEHCSFHINLGKGIYIEFWGYASDADYLSRKSHKKQRYLTHHLQLVELDAEELCDLDYALSRKLRAFGVQTE